MERRRFRLRKVHLLALPLLLLGGVLIVEVQSRWHGERELQKMLAAVREAHPDTTVRITGYYRYGRPVDGFRASWIEEAWEDTLYRLDLPAPLEGRLVFQEGRFWAEGAHAEVTLEAPGFGEVHGEHVFMWMPESRSFTPAWFGYCPRRDCPGHDIPRF